MSSYLGKDYLNWLRKFIDRNQAYLEDLGIYTSEILGCGGYGCAFATEDPFLVAKVTMDAQEINFYEFVLRHGAGYSILPHIEDISEIEPGIYLVFRERITPLDRQYWISGFPQILDHREIPGMQQFQDEIYRMIDDDFILFDVSGDNIGHSLRDGRLVIFDAQSYFD